MEEANKRIGNGFSVTQWDKRTEVRTLITDMNLNVFDASKLLRDAFTEGLMISKS